ncbi:Uncharacterised protein [Vibrio cholerae]|nr:Uncharacterised protein [Vibrio cholerae]
MIENLSYDWRTITGAAAAIFQYEGDDNFGIFDRGKTCKQSMVM